MTIITGRVQARLHRERAQVTFARSDLRHKLLSLYPNRAHHIFKSPGEPKWKFSRVRLATGMIDAAVSGQCDTFYGAYWGALTRFAVIDIDETSQYHNAAELKKLTQLLAANGLSKTVLYQSSRSTGWHLYVPFDDWVGSSDVEKALKALLKLHRYDVRGGQIEVFPSGNALRLPLQSGFAWLDESGNIVITREQLPTNEAIERFLDDMERNTNDWQIARSLINSQLQVASESAGDLAPSHAEAIANEGFDDLFSSRIIQENYEKGRKYWLAGLTEKNTRHDAIICVEHYLWHGDQGTGIPAYPGRFNDRKRYELIRQWLESNHNGYCKHIAAGDWKTVESDIWRAVLWRRNNARAPEHEPYRLTEKAQEVLVARSKVTGRLWSMEDLRKGNERRKRSARSKMRRALSAMLAAGEQITRNALADRSGCSPNTVSKHRDIWELFAARSSDLSLGVQGGCSVFGFENAAVREEKKEIDSENSVGLISAAATYAFDEMEINLVCSHPACRQTSCSSASDGAVVEEKAAESVFDLAGRVSRLLLAPPFFSCLAQSLPSNPQRQDQALRVPSEALTPGPGFDGIKAGRQECAGGLLGATSVRLLGCDEIISVRRGYGGDQRAICPDSYFLPVYTDDRTIFRLFCRVQLPREVADSGSKEPYRLSFGESHCQDVRGPPSRSGSIYAAACIRFVYAAPNAVRFNESMYTRKNIPK